MSWYGAKHATRQHSAREAWLDLVARQGHGWRQVEVIGAEQRLAEMVMMGLRLSEGIAREAFVAELGSGPETLLPADRLGRLVAEGRSEQHTSELQSLMRISYAVFCLTKKTAEHH